jgi:starch phosphorylase
VSSIPEITGEAPFEVTDPAAEPQAPGAVAGHWGAVDADWPRIAYFSMEIALEPAIPTYAGGLGILAGDMLRSAADLGLPMVAVTLIYRGGYFEQRLDDQGRQSETPSAWTPEDVFAPVEARTAVTIEGRRVHIRAWRYDVAGISGRRVPVYLLDTAMPENDPCDRALTDRIYGGDRRYRLSQEVVLGMGGARLLRALGHTRIDRYHMNEGHSALLTMALFEEQVRHGQSQGSSFDEEMEILRRRCVFTTHTPIPAGHDAFDRDLVRLVLGEKRTDALESHGLMPEGRLNMTELALACSHYVNGVAMRHGEVSRAMFPRFAIRSITNGVHARTWTAPPFQKLYDHYIPEWRRDNLYLRCVLGIPLHEILGAHAAAKRTLFEAIKAETGVTLDEFRLTLGFARRAVAYKRAELLLSDPERLKKVAKRSGPLQIIYAGKAHPADEEGKAIIRRVIERASQFDDDVHVIYIPNYDMRWGQLLTSGVDIWVNTPLQPHEASGTSGMKAALNGVPSFSVLDGWWIEGHGEGITGWSIGEDSRGDNPSSELASLYNKLGTVIAPLFYSRPAAFAEVMRGTIAFNGSFFNTHRMLHQYVQNAYGLEMLPHVGTERPEMGAGYGG